eukprot:s1789_g16.t1
MTGNWQLPLPSTAKCFKTPLMMSTCLFPDTGPFTGPSSGSFQIRAPEGCILTLKDAKGAPLPSCLTVWHKPTTFPKFYPRLQFTPPCQRLLPLRVMRSLLLVASLWLARSARDSSSDDILQEMQQAQMLGAECLEQKQREAFVVTKATSLLQVNRETSRTDELRLGEAKFNPFKPDIALMRKNFNPFLVEDDD